MNSQFFETSIPPVHMITHTVQLHDLAPTIHPLGQNKNKSKRVSTGVNFSSIQAQKPFKYHLEYHLILISTMNQNNTNLMKRCKKKKYPAPSQSYFADAILINTMPQEGNNDIFHIKYINFRKLIGQRLSFFSLPKHSMPQLIIFKTC